MVSSTTVGERVCSVGARWNPCGQHQQTGEKVESCWEMSQGSRDLRGHKGHKSTLSCGFSDWQCASLFSATFSHKNVRRLLDLWIGKRWKG